MPTEWLPEKHIYFFILALLMNAISVSSTCSSQTVHAVVQFLEKYGFVGEDSVDPKWLAFR